MTDDSTDTEPRTLRVVTCINRRHPTRSCYGLIEDDRDARIAHRQWHLNQETDREALRGAVKARDEAIAVLRQEIAGYGRDVRAYGLEVAGFHGEIRRVETPTVPPALTINREGYSDDELDDEPDEPTRTPDDLELPDDLGEAPDIVGARNPDDDRELDNEDDDEPVPARHATPTWVR
jgi:hypothetical protein